MKRHENLEEAMCAELEKLDKKYGADHGEMSVQDAEKIDLLYHALKSAETYYAMKDADGWEDKYASGRSYRRGRDAMGRYTGRDMDGYSGHYPDRMPPMYPRY
jgi:hypothetical protein